MTHNTSPGYQTAYRLSVMLVVLSLVFVGLLLIVLPLLLGLDHESIGAILMRDVGVAMLIAGLVGSSYEVVLRRAFSAEVESSLWRIINERQGELDRLRRAGLITMHRVLPHAQLIDRFEEAKKSIRILQTWSGDFNTVGDALVRAAQRGCTVRILLLNPDSPYAEQRGKDLGYEDAEAVRALISNDLATLRKCARQCGEDAKERIEVRLYESTPVMPIYGHDNVNVAGVYWRGRHSQEGPQFVLVKPESNKGDYDGEMHLAEAVDEHFNDIWNDDTTVDWNWGELADRQEQTSSQTKTEGNLNTGLQRREGLDELVEIARKIHEQIKLYGQPGGSEENRKDSTD